jgi:hypothetical protein
MKKVFVLLAIIVSLSYNVLGQNIIEKVEVIPSAPDTNDNILIQTIVRNSTTGNKLYDSISISGNQINIKICLYTSPFHSFRWFTDTFTIGKLPAGNYVVNVQAYLSYSFDCTPYDTSMKEVTFDVTFPTSTRKKFTVGNNSVSLFPNPTHGIQTLSIISEKPQNLDVRIYDVTGRMVKEVYSGKIGQGKEAFTANLQDLTPGVYLYKIVLGEEIIYSKIIKH